MGTGSSLNSSLRFRTCHVGISCFFAVGFLVQRETCHHLRFLWQSHAAGKLETPEAGAGVDASSHCKGLHLNNHFPNQAI